MADIPDIVYAGDSLEWTEGVGDYPAPTWTMHYVLRGVSILDLTSTPSGSDHAFTATATQTANLAPGRYSWQSFVSAGRSLARRDGGAVHHRDRNAYRSGEPRSADGRVRWPLARAEGIRRHRGDDGRASDEVAGDHADQQPGDPISQARGTHQVAILLQGRGRPGEDGGEGCARGRTGEPDPDAVSG